MESTIDDKKKPNPFLNNQKEEKPNPFINSTVEKKNLIPNENSGIVSEVSSTESLTPSSVSESESISVAEPSLSVSPNPTSQREIINQRERQRPDASALENVIITPPQPSIPEYKVEDDINSPFYKQKSEIKSIPYNKNIDYNSLYYSRLTPDEKALTNEILSNLDTDVYGKTDIKSEVTDDEILNYANTTLAAKGLDPVSQENIKIALEENLLGNTFSGTKGSIETVREGYKKQETERGARATLKDRYGDNYESLIEDLSINKDETDFEESNNMLRFGKKSVDLKDESIESLMNYSDEFIKGGAGVYIQMPKGVNTKSEKLSNEEAKDLYNKGLLEFENPKKNIIFSSLSSVVTPQIIEAKASKALEKEISSRAGKSYEELTPEQKVKHFAEVEQTIDAKLSDMKFIYDDVWSPYVNKWYKDLITTNNELKSLEKDISEISKIRRERPLTESEIDKAMSLNAQKQVIQEKYNSEAERIEKAKESILGSRTQLFDPATGKQVNVQEASSNPSIGQWNEDLKNATDKYTEGYKGSLKEAKVREYYNFEYFQKAILSQSRLKKYHEEVKKGNVPEDFFESNDDLFKKYYDAALELRAITRAETLNIDTKDLPRSFGQELVSGLADATIGGRKYKTDLEFAKDFNKVASENGIKLTPEQIDRAKASFKEQAGNALGSSIPAMVEIAASSLLLNATGVAAGTAEVFNVVKAMKVFKDSPKAIKFLDFAENALMTSATFELAGQGAATGLGEATGQGLAGLISTEGLTKALSSTPFGKAVSTALGTFIKKSAGASGQVFEEYAGEFFDELSKNPLTEAWATTIGDNPLEKLALQYVIAGTLGVSSLGKDWNDVKRAQEDYLIENASKSDNELVKEVVSDIKKERKLEEEVESNTETSTPDTTGLGTSEPLTPPAEEIVAEKPTPTITTVEGAETSYTTPEGDFLKESEVIELANNNDPRLSSLTLQNPSEAVSNALNPVEEVVAPIEEVETVTETETIEEITEETNNETQQNEIQQTETKTTPETIQVKKDLTIAGKNPSGKVNSTNRKILSNVTPSSPRQALLQMLISGTKIDKDTFSKETGYGITDSRGNKRGKTEQNKLRALIAKEGEKGTPLDSIVEQMKEMFPEGQTFDEQSVVNEILDILNTHENTTSMAEELLDNYSHNGVIYNTLEAKAEAMEIDEQNKIAEDMQQWEAQIEEEAKNSEEEVAKYIEENKFDEYLKTATDEELEKYYGPEAIKREVAKPNTKTESGVNDKKGQDGQGAKPKVEPSTTLKVASSLRDMASKIRESQKGTLNTAIVSPELFAKGLDALATILEKADELKTSFNDALKEWRESDEYKSLDESDKKELEKIAKEQVESVGEKYESDTKTKPDTTEKKSGNKVRTVTNRFINSGGLTEEQAQTIAEGSIKVPESNEAKLKIAQDLENTVGLEKAYELTTSSETSDLFSQETKNYIAIATLMDLKEQLQTETNPQKRNEILSKITKASSIVSANALSAGRASAFYDKIYEVFPEMRTEKTAIDTINEKMQESLDAPSDNPGQTVQENIDEIREKIKEELRAEIESELESLKEKINELQKKKNETKAEAKERIKSKREQYKADLKKAFSGKSSSASSSIIGLNNDAITAIAGIISTYIEEGFVNAKSIINNTLKDLKEIGVDVTKEQVEEIANKNKDYSSIKGKNLSNGKTNPFTSKEIKNILEDYFVNGTSTKASLIEHLMNGLNLTKSEAKSIAAELESKIEEKVKEVATKELEKNMAPPVSEEAKAERAKKAVENRKLVNKISKSVMLGELSTTDFRNSFAEKYNLPNITTEQLNNLTELVRLSKEYEKNNQRELFIKAQRKINTDVKSMSKKDAKFYSGIAMELAYLNALSGVNTQFNANIGASATSLLNGMAKILDEVIIKRNPMSVVFGLKAMGKSLKAASASAKDARKFNYNKYTDYGSYTEGSTALEMGVIENTVLKGAAKYFREVSKDKGITENTKNLLKGIGISMLQYSRLNFLLNASDAFLTTQISEFNSAIETYNKTASELNVTKAGRLITNKELEKTLDKAMGYSDKADFEKQAETEIEAEKERINSEIAKMGLDPKAAAIEYKTRVNATISKGYKARRVQELMEQSRDRKIQETAVKTAKDWIMLSDPDGVFGMVNYALKRMMTPKETDTGTESVMRTLAGLTIMFSRMTFNTMNAVLTSIPLVGVLPSVVGFVKTEEGWKTRYKGNYDPLLMRRRLMANAILTTVGTAVFAEMFEWDDDDEEFKLDPNRLIDITAGAFGPNQIEKNKQALKNYGGMGVAISFRSSPDEEFDTYRSFKLMPHALPMLAIIGNVADKQKNLGSEKSLKSYKDGKIVWSSLGVSMNQLLEGSFNSLGRTTKAVQMSNPDNAAETLGLTALELVTSPLKTITQPNFYRDVINEAGLRGDKKKQYPKDLWGKLIYDYYALDSNNKNKTDLFGNEIDAQGKASQWLDGNKPGVYDNKEYDVIFKYPEVNITPYKPTESFTVKKWSYEIVDEEVIEEMSQIQKKELKDVVLDNYDYLMKLDAEELQKELTSIKNESVEYAKKEIEGKYYKDPSKIKEVVK